MMRMMIRRILGCEMTRPIMMTRPISHIHGDNAATASNLAALGSVELADGRFDKSQGYYNEALAMHERVAGRTGEQRRRELDAAGRTAIRHSPRPA